MKNFRPFLLSGIVILPFSSCVRSTTTTTTTTTTTLETPDVKIQQSNPRLENGKFVHDGLSIRFREGKEVLVNSFKISTANDTNRDGVLDERDAGTVSTVFKMEYPQPHAAPIELGRLEIQTTEHWEWLVVELETVGGPRKAPWKVPVVASLAR